MLEDIFFGKQLSKKKINLKRKNSITYLNGSKNFINYQFYFQLN